MIAFPEDKEKELSAFRKKFDKGDHASQIELDAFNDSWAEYREFLKPHEKDEVFFLVDSHGQFKEVVAPRWICHLLNLRHKSVHVLLKWISPAMGEVFLLQVRSWSKSDSPGSLDISIGGHVTGNSDENSIEAVYREMEEELGLSKSLLKYGHLTYVTGYESTDTKPEAYFYNTEWRDVYIGEIETNALEHIRFNDNEVTGIYLCPRFEASNLLVQEIIPIASALKLSLPKLLESF